MPHQNLHYAYNLAHSASCRLQVEASRPDRNLRFLVGHLMHYEAMRLHIVEIEHDVGRRERQRERERAEVERLLGRSVGDDEGGEEDSESDGSWSGSSTDEDSEGEGKPSGGDTSNLDLQRMSTTENTRAPALIADQGDEKDAEEESNEPPSPEQPDDETLQCVINGPQSEELKGMYGCVSRCTCHDDHEDAPQFSRVWEWPREGDQAKKGSTRMIAEVQA